jgi:glycosyltransferase involved in cell wall biosynthesis
METVTIVMSTYNNEDIIEKCIMSCLNQYYKNLNILIADDGSTDSTLEIEQRLEQKYDKLKVFALPHGERGVARKTVIDEAKKLNSDYLYIIDSDMILKEGLINECLDYFEENSKVGALIIPEIAFSEYDNFMSKVKVFERNIINNAGINIGENSIEAARFWKMSEYEKTGGINPKQISFEETQPTIRYVEMNGVIKRAVFTGVMHNEKRVTLENILKKKKYYFSKMPATLSSEESGFMKALKRWYFFRPVLYRYDNIQEYFKHPILTFGMLYMYLRLTLIGVGEIIKSKNNS